MEPAVEVVEQAVVDPEGCTASPRLGTRQNVDQGVARPWLRMSPLPNRILLEVKRAHESTGVDGLLAEIPALKKYWTVYRTKICGGPVQLPRATSSSRSA